MELPRAAPCSRGLGGEEGEAPEEARGEAGGPAGAGAEVRAGCGVGRGQVALGSASGAVGTV